MTFRRWAPGFRACFLSTALLQAAPLSRTAAFTAGIEAYTSKDYLAALEKLTAASRDVPLLADYVTYHLASSRLLSGDAAGALREIRSAAVSAPVLSPLGGKAALLSAQIYLQLHNPAEAIRVLRDGYDALPQPEGDLLLAQSYEAAEERPQAAALYQRVYYLRPATQAAVAASGALERVKTALGAAYPPPPPEQMIARGDAWLTARNYAKAKAEYQSLLPQLPALTRDQAFVRIAAADLLGGNTRFAVRALEALHIARSEADSERLYYLAEGARKLNDDASLNATLDTLERRYPASPWRLKALISAANRYLLSHDAARYVPLFTAAYRKFPADSVTAYAHWRVTWDAYLKRSATARSLLEEQVTTYSADPRAAGALYFLGRIAEEAGDWGSANDLYGTVLREFPNFYYGVLAAGRLEDKRIAAATASGATQWVSTVNFPPRPDLANEAPTPATKIRIERARLLTSAGLPAWAQNELRFGAATDGQQHLLALEVAREDPAPALALRHMKGLAPEYLSLPLANAPREFWQFLFPLPYRDSLTASAKAQELDPFLLAGLIRQESEFNPGAISRANALGLTQMVAGTGRMMAKGQGLRSFSSAMLFDPDVSLRLGAAYLKVQLSQWNGNLEQTLAAYNAGPGRVREWLAWSSYREPAEFVESIPFTETREYVQAVIRNASLYRRLYTAHPVPEVKSPAVESRARPAIRPSHTAAKKKSARRG